MTRNERARSWVGMLVACLVLALAQPAAAWEEKPDQTQHFGSHPVFDLMFLRPFGVISAGIGGLLFLFPVGPITLATRPHEIGQPFETLVLKPARYVVSDPLGSH